MDSHPGGVLTLPVAVKLWLCELPVALCNFTSPLCGLPVALCYFTSVYSFSALLDVFPNICSRTQVVFM